jgi:hypothetical protein
MKKNRYIYLKEKLQVGVRLNPHLIATVSKDGFLLNGELFPLDKIDELTDAKDRVLNDE